MLTVEIRVGGVPAGFMTIGREEGLDGRTGPYSYVWEIWEGGKVVQRGHVWHTRDDGAWSLVTAALADAGK